MIVEPRQEDWILARKIHDTFRKKPGAQHIATAFALAHLSRILNTEKPRKVLELGAGIGTITYLLASHPCAPGKIVSTEENAFCLGQLERNIPPEYMSKVDLVTVPEEIVHLDERFDLVIFDSSHDEFDISNLLKEGAICFVEGSRKPTRKSIREKLERIGMRCDFTNHTQGRKLVHVYTRRWNILGLSIPKIRFFKSIKGCWIGRVERI